MSKEKINVLYLDDEAENLNSFKANFRRDFNVFPASSPSEAFDIINANDIHIAISDHKMPHITGVQFFEDLSISHPEVIRILLTGYTDVQTVIESINRGQVYRYFSKPMDPDEIRGTIISAYNFYLENQEKQDTYKKLQAENEQLEFMLRQKLIS